MNNSVPDTFSLVEEFHRRQQAGEQPDPFEFIREHPGVAPELERLLTPAIEDHLASNSENLSRAPDGELPAAIGRYRIHETLGSGSSAVVYRTYDPKFERFVALKVFRADPTDKAGSSGRFERDARTLARLRHTHIVQLHETGECDGLRYIDMELVTGQTLEARLGVPPPPDFREAAQLIWQVADALDHAHRAGVVHRDVKPSNILLDADGAAQLTDFGHARRIDVDKSLTLLGQMLGTPAYMSPEQARGQAHDADARSDVYSLGVVLYRLITGRLPFEDASAHKLLHQIETQEPMPPRRLRPSVPLDLETICLKAMEKRPEDRFPTAAAMAGELWRWLHDEPITIRRHGLWERTRRWAKRNRLLTRSSLVAAGLLIGCATLGWTAWNLKKGLSLETEYRARADVRSLLDQAWQQIRSPQMGRRIESQKTLLSIAKPRRLITNAKELDDIDLEARSLFAMTLALPDLETTETIKLPASAFHTWPVVFRPDGAAIAIGTGEKPIVWRLGQKPALPDKLETLGQPPRIAFSPDSRYLSVAQASGGLQIWDGDGAQLLNSPVEPSQGPVLSVGWSDSILRAVLAAGRVRSWSLPHFREIGDWSIPDQPPTGWTAARFAPDGMLAIGSGAGEVRMFDGKGQFVRRIVDPTVRTEVQAIAWSPDANQVVVGLKGGRIQLRRADGTKIRELRQSMEVICSLEVIPAHNRLLAAGVGGGTSLWDIATGELLLTTAGVSGSFSADGQTLASGTSDEVHMRRLESPTAIRVFRGHGDCIARLAWSDDGRRLASLDASFDIRVWDVEKHSQLDDYQAPVGGFFASNAAIALNRDGSLLAYAGGGERKSKIMIRDTLARKDAGAWEFGGGYDFLAATGPDQFLLVREEIQPNSRNVQTVTRVLRPHQPPSPPKLLRRCDPADQGRFVNAQLNPDGTHYLWVGPREPAAAQRVEVWEVGIGRRVALVPCPRSTGCTTDAYLDPAGRMFWVSDRTETFRYDLCDGLPLATSSEFPSAVAPDLNREVRGQDASSWHNSPVVLSKDAVVRDWLRLASYDESSVGSLVFSTNGNRLAWGTRSGLVYLAELKALVREIDAFEDTLRHPR